MPTALAAGQIGARMGGMDAQKIIDELLAKASDPVEVDEWIRVGPWPGREVREMTPEQRKLMEQWLANEGGQPSTFGRTVLAALIDAQAAGPSRRLRLALEAHQSASRTP